MKKLICAILCLISTISFATDGKEFIFKIEDLNSNELIIETKISSLEYQNNIQVGKPKQINYIDIASTDEAKNSNRISNHCVGDKCVPLIQKEVFVGRVFFVSLYQDIMYVNFKNSKILREEKRDIDSKNYITVPVVLSSNDILSVPYSSFKSTKNNESEIIYTPKFYDLDGQEVKVKDSIKYRFSIKQN